MQSVCKAAIDGSARDEGLPAPTYSVTDGKRELWLALPAGWQVDAG
jgi:hypothetical protein